MKSNKARVLKIFVVLFGSFIVSCGGEHMPLPGPETSPQQEQEEQEEESPLMAGSTTYEDIQPIFEQRCSVCHNPDSGLGNWMDPLIAAAGADRIYERVLVQRDMPPENATNMTDEEREMVGQWVEEGAYFEGSPGFIY